MASEKRLQILLPPASVERLERLLVETEMSSYAEVIRNAIRLYEWMVRQAKAGKRFGMSDSDANFKQVDIFGPKDD